MGLAPVADGAIEEGATMPLLTPVILADAALLLALCGVYTYRLCPRAPLNQRLLFLCLFLAISNGLEAFGYGTTDATACATAYHLAWIGWVGYPLMAVLVALALTGASRRLTRTLTWCLGLIAGMLFARSAVSLLGISGFEPTGHGTYIPVAAYGPWDLAYVIYQYGSDLLALALIARWGFTSSLRRHRRQAMIVLLAAGGALLLDAVHYFVGHRADMSVLWAVEQLLFAGGLTYAVARHRFTEPTVELATRQILPNIHDLVLLLSAEGTILDVNTMVPQLLGCERAALIGRPLVTLFLPGETCPLLEMPAQGQHPPAVTRERTLLAADGTVVPVMLTCAVLCNEHQDTIGIVCTAQDLRPRRRLEAEIAERSAVEAALRRSQESLEEQVQQRTVELADALEELRREINEREHVQRSLRQQFAFLQQVIDTVPNPIFCRDLDGVYTACNAAFADFFGLPRTAIIGRRTADFTPRAYAETIQTTDTQVLRDGGMVTLELQVARTDGIVADIQTRKVPFVGDDGTPAGVVGVFADVTERRTMERALRVSEEHYRRIFETIQDIFFRLDLDGTLREVSPSVTAITGYAPEALVGHPVSAMDVDVDHFTRLFTQLLATGAIHDEEIDIVSEAKATVTLALNAHLVRDAAGEPVAIEGIMRDITARRQAEAALRTSQRMLARAQQIAGIGSWEWDLRTNSLMWSDQMYRLYDLDPTTTQPSYALVMAHTHPEDRPAIEAELQRVYAEQIPYAHEHRILTGTGAMRHILAQAEVTFDEDGQALRMTGTALDITARVQAERLIVESEARFRRIVDNFPGVIWITRLEPERSHVFISDKIAALCGYPAENFLDGTLFYTELADLDDAASRREAIIKALRSGKTYTTEYRLRHRDGSQRWVLEIGQALYNDTGHPHLLEGMLLDITERKVAEETIHRYEQELRAMAHALDLAQEHERHRLAVDVHDHICQPLVFANIKVQALRQSCPPEERQTLGDITSTLSELIKLTYSLTFDLSPPVLHELGFDAALEWLAERTKSQHGLEVTVDHVLAHEPLDDELALVLFRMVQELLANVVKHAHAHRVCIAVLGITEGLRIEVTDDGTGFAAIPDTEGYAGGFGIFSMRERLRFYQGRLEIESTPGHGSCVSLIVPLSVAPTREDSDDTCLTR
jgi:PAS domain S-box-containing protein